MYEYKGWRVWRLNEYDWVCAKRFYQAVDYYKNLTGLDFEDAVDFHSLEDVDLNSTMRVERDPDEKFSFKEAIDYEYKIHGGEEPNQPWVIASTEN